MRLTQLHGQSGVLVTKSSVVPERWRRTPTHHPSVGTRSPTTARRLWAVERQVLTFEIPLKARTSYRECRITVHAGKRLHCHHCGRLNIEIAFDAHAMARCRSNVGTRGLMLTPGHNVKWPPGIIRFTRPVSSCRSGRLRLAHACVRHLLHTERVTDVGVATHSMLHTWMTVIIRLNQDGVESGPPVMTGQLLWSASFGGTPWNPA